ncbi:MAG: fimbrillin family protein [Paludibacteraceae bacterium]|nr:fimbrillin family protein [Paludibacteraceae bacterium]
MKKIIYLTGAALVMLASVSCEKKETVKEAQSSVEKTEMVFTATSEKGGLKTTIKEDGTTAVWSATDNLKVFTAEDTKGSVCDIISGAGTTEAEFEGMCAKTGPWTAIYPASSAKSFSDGTITLKMPEIQTYAENTFAQGAMPCVAYSSTTEFTFNHSFGVLKINLKLKEGKTGSVKSITLTTKSSEKLWGTFTVNPQSGPAATEKSDSEGTTSITLDCGAGVALSTSAATGFWVVVPQDAFASGFDVTVTSTDDFLATLSTSKANTITAGKVKEMPIHLIEFKDPTKGEAMIEDGTMVKWVQLWEGGPKFAEYNVGAKSVEEYGDYFHWGGTYRIKSGTVYTDDHYTGEGPLTGDNDAATKYWGSDWRMPRYGECDSITISCDRKWVQNYNNTNVAGMLITGKGKYSGNSLFFPAGGDGYKATFSNKNVVGNYWSSDGNGAATNPFAWYFCVSNTPYITMKTQTAQPNRGYLVRPVLVE